MPKKRSQKYQQTKISTLTISLMKKNKNKSYIFDYSQQKQNSSSSSKSHQIKPNYSIDSKSSKKNCNPKFKYYLKYYIIFF